MQLPPSEQLTAEQLTADMRQAGTFTPESGYNTIQALESLHELCLQASLHAMNSPLRTLGSKHSPNTVVACAQGVLPQVQHVTYTEGADLCTGPAHATACGTKLRLPHFHSPHVMVHI